jgi:type I restriction enzyme, S subunit
MKWEKVKIGEITTQIRGVSYSPSDVSEIEDEYSVPILRANNITDHGLIFEDLVYVNKKVVSAKQLLREGDIVIAASSGSKHIVGKAAYFKNHWTGSFGAFCKVIRPSEKTCSKYLSYYFRTDTYRKTISNLSAGANINNLKTEHLDELEILLPPVPIQQKIAAILDEADALRRKDAELLVKYDELLQSIFYDMFGDPVKNEKGWEVKTIESISKKIQIGPFGSLLHVEDYVHDGIPLINPTHIVKGKINIDRTFTISPNKAKELKNYLLKSGDIVMGRRGEMGRCAIVSNNEDGFLCGTGSLYIRPNDQILSTYLNRVLSSTKMKEELEHKAMGVTMSNLNQAIIKNLMVAVPPIAIQNKYSLTEEGINEQKITLLQQQSHSEALFQSLMQRAFKGELVV